MSSVAKKKGSSNGFSRFMFSYKSQEKAKGRDLDMATVTSEAGALWEVNICFSNLINLTSILHRKCLNKKRKNSKME